MKQFKKRTLALVLASVVTVVGSFASENYKNSLMNMSLKVAESGAIDMVLQTRTAYEGNIAPVRKDANTYIIMLPDVDSQASTPDLKDVSGNIQSVNVRTMPYSKTGNGYTRITIKTTNPEVKLNTSQQVYIPSESTRTRQITTNSANVSRTSQSRQQRTVVEKNNSNDLGTRHSRTQRYVEEENQEIVEDSRELETDIKHDTPAQAYPKNNAPALDTSDYDVPKDSSEAFLLIMGIFLTLIVSAYLYVRAKNKMHELAVEKLDLDVNDYGDATDGPQIKKIAGTIVTLDSLYKKSAGLPKKSEYTKPVISIVSKPVEKVNVVDLDELFQEQKAKMSESEENDALEEFLSGFSFDETYANQELEEEAGYDKEFYEEVLKRDNIRFTKKEYKCILELLDNELTLEVRDNLKEYAAKNPPNKAEQKQKMLENLVTTYAISQSIMFDKDDISILDKLLNVELDRDFVTDLRTDSERTKEVQRLLEEERKELKKPSEIITLNVKDLLPDLSEELRKQGNKRIESNYKPEVVYYSEGYEFETLTLNDSSMNLSFNPENLATNTYKPSADVDYADKRFQVGNSSISMTPLNGVKETDVNNDAVKSSVSTVPTVSEVKKEFQQFENFEIAEEQEDVKVTQNNLKQEDSEITEEYIDLDKEREKELEAKTKSEPKKDDFVPLKLERNIPNSLPINRQKKDNDLVKKINETKEEYSKNKLQENKIATDNTKKIQEDVKCIFGGETHTIISSVNLAENKGCHLAKNENGYTVFGFIGDKLTVLKQYESLKSEKIQARKDDKLAVSSSRYIVRIGLNKFIVDVEENDIKYVMDLC